MALPLRLSAAVVLAAAWSTGFVLAQGQAPPAPAAPAQGQPPAGGRGQVQVPAGARVGGFTQYTRPLASQEVLIRGKALYDNMCASCHQVDMRGTVDGKNPNLLRSGVALRDQRGELIGGAVKTHKPTINLVDTDTVAVAEYIHSVHASMGGQGSPPGRNPTNVTLNVLVGDAKAGAGLFQQRCGACHSVTGNLRGIASKFADARALQNGWVSGASGMFGGGGGRGGGGGVPGVVTLANGTRLEGTIARHDDFMVTIILTDGTRRTIMRNDGVPRVEERDPKQGHTDAIVKLAHEDTTSKIMHDITAYLWTVK
jgi:cytochrome c oxidase cbb3-type subunit 3